MPPSLQLLVVFNPAQPRREVFLSGPVSFGRDPANRVVLPEPAISRKHGRIEEVDGQWVLFNESDNGTEVNGKSVGKKGRPLANRDVVAVGDRKLFEVILDTPATGDAPTEAQGAQNEPKTKKGSLLKPIGLILLLYVVVYVVIFTSGTSEKKRVEGPPPLTAEEIKVDICRPIKPVTPDEGKGNDCLKRANDFYAARQTDLTNTYRAYENYRLALAYLEKTSFDDDQLSQRRYLEVQDDLIKRVTEYYKRGYAQLQSKQYEEAEATFSRLRREIYPDVESKTSRNVDEQRVLLGPNLKKKRR